MWDSPFEEYEVPENWTPEHVLHRMVLGYEVSEALRVRVGPGRVRAAWPNIWHDQGDRNSQVSHMLKSDGSEETIDERDHRLSSDKWNDWERERRVSHREMTLMEESMAWPSRYLGGTVQIGKWAHRRATENQADKAPSATEIQIAMVFAEAKIISRGLIGDRVVVLREDVQD